ncbi:MAG: AraC family transcriptional regulator [Mobilitalea sp.]
MWYYLYPSIDNVKNFPMYLISIGLHELQPYIGKPNGHEYDQFFFHCHGSGVLKMNNKTYNLPENSAFFIPAGVPHEYYPLESTWDVRWMVPAGYALNELYRQLSIEKGGAYSLSEAAPLDTILNKMHYELVQNKENGTYFASSYVYEFILEFARQTGKLLPCKPESHDSKDPYVRQMELLHDFIEYHYMHPISLNDLCQLVSVTPQHLCRIFKRCTGQRPMAYISQRRIKAAKDILLKTQHSINDISLWCGFENLNYFYKCFKQQTNTTPGEYRQKHLNKGEIE